MLPADSKMIHYKSTAAPTAGIEFSQTDTPVHQDSYFSSNCHYSRYTKFLVVQDKPCLQTEIQYSTVHNRNNNNKKKWMKK